MFLGIPLTILRCLLVQIALAVAVAPHKKGSRELFPPALLFAAAKGYGVCVKFTVWSDPTDIITGFWLPEAAGSPSNVYPDLYAWTL